MKTYTITAPEGMLIDEISLKEGKIEFIPKPKELPSEWELEANKQYFSVSNESRIAVSESFVKMKHPISYWNSLPSEELAKAMLSLCKLLVMRDRYNDGWVPDWLSEDFKKYCISGYEGEIIKDTFLNSHKILAFKNPEVRDLFFKNFKEDIEIAKPLL